MDSTELDDLSFFSDRIGIDTADFCDSLHVEDSLNDILSSCSDINNSVAGMTEEEILTTNANIGNLMNNGNATMVSDDKCMNYCGSVNDNLHRSRSSSASNEGLQTTSHHTNMVEINSTYSTMNAVHMKLQENAKIPNLYHIPQRRQPRSDAGTNRRIQNKSIETKVDVVVGGKEIELVDEIMRLNEVDRNLSEAFLESEDRTSAAAAYSNSGALLSFIGTKVDSLTKNTVDHEGGESSSEEEKKMREYKNDINGNERDMNTQIAGTKTKHSSAVACDTEITHKRPKCSTLKDLSSKNELQSNYYYGRPIPLPIPSHPTPQESEFGVTKSNTVVPQYYQPYYSNTQPTPSFHATTNTAINSNDIAVSKTSINSAKKSANHKPTRPTPSLLDATRKRSQFGFGADHTISSLPLPSNPKTIIVSKKRKKKTVTKNMPTSNTAGDTPVYLYPQPYRPIINANTIKTPDPGSTRKNNTEMSSLVPIPAAPKVSKSLTIVNEGPSYERKKQRAKDARVKLKESIERLSISINVAGNQSKERAQLYSQIHMRVASRDNDSVAVTSSRGAKSGRHLIVKSMEDIGKAADLAKKWDRPSFVGTAATLVQGLNAQCEALMREVVRLREEQAKWNEKTEEDSKVNKGFIGGDIHCKFENRKMRKEELEENDGKLTVRTEIEAKFDSTFSMMTILKHGRVMKSIVAYLDPISITRCVSVSRSWYHQRHYFTDSSIWLHLCALRFGTSNVREWQNHLCREAECNDEKEYDIEEIEKSNMMQLYREMNINNVKPRCHFEGNLCLGEGKINNAVSAWVSAVNRSNGELLRTVQSVHGGSRKYSSIPVVELRVMIQNIGVGNGGLFIPEQKISVDASTKRRGEEMSEISSDERFAKRLLRLDGSKVPFLSKNHEYGQNCVGSFMKLDLFEVVILCCFIHARSCQTTAKFRKKANFMKLLVSIHGTTLPLVMPITS